MNKYDLEERLIEFSVLIIEIVNEMPNTKAGNHLSGQLVRSGTSPALNYGEAQSAESKKDFIHKTPSRSENRLENAKVHEGFGRRFA